MLDAGISLQSARKAVESLRGVRRRPRVGAHRARGTERRARAERRADDRSPARRSGRAEHRARPRSRCSRRSPKPCSSRSTSTPTARRARPRAEEARERVIDSEVLPHELVRFAHNSERQFAKLLDFYGIAWEYEPRTFTLERDRDGRPVQAFTPDFYLPAYDLYIEITTLNQKLVTKKNRKARRLRRAVPRRRDPGAVPARLPAPAREVRARAAVAARRRRCRGGRRRRRSVEWPSPLDLAARPRSVAAGSEAESA